MTKLYRKFAWFPRFKYFPVGAECWWYPSDEWVWMKKSWYFEGVFGEFFITDEAYQILIEMKIPIETASPNSI